MLLFNNRSYFVTSENGTVARWKVSAKIQQLLNTLKKPKKRHLEEFYEDDDIELEMAANPKDPNAPSPEGMFPVPVYFLNFSEVFFVKS